LESVQHPPGPMGGHLKDITLAAFLSGLKHQEQGLCIITTQIALEGLATQGPRVARIKLPPLTPQEGAELLVKLGVRGKQDELETAAREYGGHALSVALLGTYLHEWFDGDVKERFKIKPLIDPGARGRFPQDETPLLKGDERAVRLARTLVASYEKSFEEQGDPIAQTALAILRLLGLFDRPVEQEWLDFLREEPISGLTEPFFATAPNLEETWQKALRRLRSAKLIYGSPKPAPMSAPLAAHPLICQYFANQLQEHFRDAALRAHSFLFNHFKTQVVPDPRTREQLDSFYRAVYHGCKGELYSEAFNVFWEDIARKE